MSLSPRAFLHLRSTCLQKSPAAHSKTAYRKLHSATDKMTVQRITMFKVANEADIPQFFERYQTLNQNQKKVHQFQHDCTVCNRAANRSWRTSRTASLTSYPSTHTNQSTTLARKDITLSQTHHSLPLMMWSTTTKSVRHTQHSRLLRKKRSLGRLWLSCGRRLRLLV